jgi:tRNA-splicing ligase RtcB (3'-phosphate/5'-hydroxy nucleic acid ligase)
MHRERNIRFFIPPDQIEQEALQQIRNTASMPFVHGLAVMPDAHFGMGSTVGTVVATEGAVMPACVGVDIGCGMIAVRTNLSVEQVMPLRKQIREGIERRIPVGIGGHGENSKVLPSSSLRIGQLHGLADRLGVDMDKRHTGWRKQLGSLGGGNHFIEVCIGRPIGGPDGALIDRDPPYTGEIWIILHSGSRGVGNKTGNYWTKIAKGLEKHYMNGVQIPDQNLAALIDGTPEYEQYMKELHWCQEFARLNREEMMDRVLTELWYQVHVLPSGINPKTEAPELAARQFLEIERINSHHNYATIEHHEGKDLLVTRKGAILANAGKRSLIPGSMGTNSYIVEGLGNLDSFNSAPHGAGRRMSRTRARQMFTVETLTEQMAERDIESRVREAIVDESPGAYKDIEQTMAHASELIRPLYRLRQILNVKGD